MPKYIIKEYYDWKEQQKDIFKFPYESIEEQEQKEIETDICRLENAEEELPSNLIKIANKYGGKELIYDDEGLSPPQVKNLISLLKHKIKKPVEQKTTWEDIGEEESLTPLYKTEAEIERKIEDIEWDLKELDKIYTTKDSTSISMGFFKKTYGIEKIEEIPKLKARLETALKNFKEFLKKFLKKKQSEETSPQNIKDIFPSSIDQNLDIEEFIKNNKEKIKKICNAKDANELHNIISYVIYYFATRKIKNQKDLKDFKRINNDLIEDGISAFKEHILGNEEVTKINRSIIKERLGEVLKKFETLKDKEKLTNDLTFGKISNIISEIDEFIEEYFNEENYEAGIGKLIGLLRKNPDDKEAIQSLKKILTERLFLVFKKSLNKVKDQENALPTLISKAMAGFEKLGNDNIELLINFIVDNFIKGIINAHKKKSEEEHAEAKGT